MNSTDDKTVLAISSQVVYGSVGLSIAVPCMESFGFRVLPVPTVILASRPGLGTYTALEIQSEDLGKFLLSLRTDGWFDRISGILTGYFLNPEQVRQVADTITLVKEKRKGVVYVCDPVLGDIPEGLYVSEETGEAVKSHLLPIADLATPNLFEAFWLTGTEPDPALDTKRLKNLAKSLNVENHVITSAVPNRIKISSALSEGDLFSIIEHKRFDDVPKGTGDAFSALMLANILKSSSLEIAFENSLHQIEWLAETASGDKTFSETLRRRYKNGLFHKSD
ncbi:MAG: bifunctional hydroxymethylpyrimidine kinase/phosphomethylpyrimidine kinase [Desulfobulbia bacterium]